MANRFWVGAGTTWSNADTSNWSTTTGGGSGASVPGASDTAVFDGNSGSGTITTNYVASLSALTLNTSFAGTVVFGNSFTTSGTTTLTNGTLNTNGQAFQCNVFSSSGSLVRALILGASTVTVPGASQNVWNCGVATNMTVTPGSSSITCTGNAATVSMGPGLTYNNFSITGSGTAIIGTGSNGTSVVNFTRSGTAVKTDGLSLNVTIPIVVSGTLTLTGQSAINRLNVFATTVGNTITPFTVSSNPTLTNIDVADITASGSTPWTGTSLGDAGGNSGITFDPAVSQTWNGNTAGSWSDITKWTSRVPLPQDNVIVNGLTSNTITGDMPRLGANIDMTGSTGGKINISQAVSIFGSLTQTTGSQFTGSSTFSVTFSGRGSYTITSAGHSFPGTVIIGAFGGTYTLQDTLNTPFNISSSGGAFVTNGNAVNCSTFISTSGSGRSSDFGSSIVSLTSTAATTVWNVSNSQATFSAASATIVISTASTNSRTFAGSSISYGTLTYTAAGSTGSLVVTGTPTFGTVNFSDASNPRTLTLPSSKTTTITSTNGFNVDGSAGKLVTINSSTPGAQATLSSSANQLCKYLQLTDSAATGGGNWLAQTSTNVSNNTGWDFTRAPNSDSGTRTTAGARQVAGTRAISGARNSIGT